MPTTPVKTDFTGVSVTEGGFRTAFNNLIDWLIAKVYLTDGDKGDIIVSGSGLAWKARFQRSTLAISATLMDIWAQNTTIDVTGTALTITNIVAASAPGDFRVLYLPAGTIITNGVVFTVQGNADYTILAGDEVIIRAITTTTFSVTINKKNGTAVVAQTTAITTTVGDNSTKIATTAYVDAPKLGTRSAGLTTGVNYLASSDGFIYGSSVSSAAASTLICYSDATATPSTLLGNCGSNTTINNYYFPFCFPIKKGEYFRVDVTGTVPNVYKFIPIGV
jgi:hypothetical protein